MANQASTYLAWFRAVAKKYSHKTKAEILADLVAHTPGEEGKWFATAKSAKLFDEAIELAKGDADEDPHTRRPRDLRRPIRHPCPQPLSRTGLTGRGQSGGTVRRRW